MDRIPPWKWRDLLCKAREEKLIDFTSAHDDDLVAWDPHHLEDDLDPSEPRVEDPEDHQGKARRRGAEVHDGHLQPPREPVFRNGGLSNPNPEVRMLAARKVMRTIRIGNFLGAEYLTYWVARDGFECQFAVPWERNYRYLIDGLNLVERYAKEQNGSVRHGTIEPKPNEPRGRDVHPHHGTRAWSHRHAE